MRAYNDVWFGGFDEDGRFSCGRDRQGEGRPGPCLLQWASACARGRAAAATRKKAGVHQCVEACRSAAVCDGRISGFPVVESHLMPAPTSRRSGLRVFALDATVAPRHTKAMIYSLSGTVQRKQDGWAVIEVQGVGYKVTLPLFVISRLPAVGETVALVTHHHVREDASDLYGFLKDEELSLFQSLISVSGIGPKSAMGIMGVAPVNELIAAINEGRVDLLSKASGVGKKTAERAVLELKGKLAFGDTSGTIQKMEGDTELEETLVGLGYSKAHARTAIEKLDPQMKDFQERLKAILKNYKK